MRRRALVQRIRAPGLLHRHVPRDSAFLIPSPRCSSGRRRRRRRRLLGSPPPPDGAGTLEQLLPVIAAAGTTVALRRRVGGYCCRRGRNGSPMLDITPGGLIALVMNASVAGGPIRRILRVCEPEQRAIRGGSLAAVRFGTPRVTISGGLPRPPKRVALRQV